MVPFTVEGPVAITTGNLTQAGNLAPAGNVVTVSHPGHHLAPGYLVSGHHHLAPHHLGAIQPGAVHTASMSANLGQGGPMTTIIGQGGLMPGIRYPPPPQRGFTTVPPPHTLNAPMPPPHHIPSCALHPSSLHPPPSVPPGAYPRHNNNNSQQQLASRQHPNPGSGYNERLYLNKHQQIKRKQIPGKKAPVNQKGAGKKGNGFYADQVDVNQENHHEEGHKKVLSAQELTGAPLISYATRNRKLKKKTSEPCTTISGNQQAGSVNYYVYTYPSVPLQDMYHNPMYSQNHQNNNSSSGLNTNKKISSHKQHRQEREDSGATTTSEPTFDSHSVSSEDLEHFLPRIIRPRRRRKKDRKEKALQGQEEGYNQQSGNKHPAGQGGKGKVISGEEEGKPGLNAGQNPGSQGQEEPEMLGSEKQWLPQGLLSAESSYDSRSESGSSGDDVQGSGSGHRKLVAAMSMPVYPSYTAPIYFNPMNKQSETSDYSSLTSNSSEYHSSNNDSHGSDNPCDSDSRSEANSTPSHEIEETVINSEMSSSIEQLRLDSSRQDKPMLVKSTSSSFFRSPRMSGRGEQSLAVLSPGEVRKRNLRKTNSWHPMTHQDDSMATFSLFSPAGSIDLLSGIRKNLSKLDINSEAD